MPRHRNPARSALHFPDAARSAFRFLKTFGFREVSADQTIVRFANKGVILNVFHGRSSYELAIEIGLVGGSTHSMSALIRLTDANESARFRNPVATKPEEVRDGLRLLAELMRKYGQGALSGEMSVFSALDRDQREWSERYAGEVAYRQVLPQADEAFRQHDYAKAARLYESIKGELSPTELKKLEYARKHSDAALSTGVNHE